MFFQKLTVVASLLFLSSISYTLEEARCDENTPCANGACCSWWGWCGTGIEYCGITCINNCSSGSGAAVPAGATRSVDGSCDANTLCPPGNCCSKFGFCGNSDLHCVSACASQCTVTGGSGAVYSDDSDQGQGCDSSSCSNDDNNTDQSDSGDGTNDGEQDDECDTSSCPNDHDSTDQGNNGDDDTDAGQDGECDISTCPDDDSNTDQDDSGDGDNDAEQDDECDVSACPNDDTNTDPADSGDGDTDPEEDDECDISSCPEDDDNTDQGYSGDGDTNPEEDDDTSNQ